MTNGIDPDQAVFTQAHAESRAVFMPYHAMGYPDRATTLAIISTLGAAAQNFSRSAFRTATRWPMGRRSRRPPTPR
jgi:hypothetical protein